MMDDLESGERIIGCLPGETPASFTLLQQERRHRAELIAKDAEIAELRSDVSVLLEFIETHRIVLNKEESERFVSAILRADAK